MEAQLQDTTKPRLLFVDDEKRVLNSMRIMFRRQFDLFLASHGAEALDIVKEKDIDVIIADHRMPQMTGVEVLTAVRKLSPRTVRILLTGYADLDAVEGSINDSEVFRFLTKPCAPDQLRSTIELAATVARETPVSRTSIEEIEDITAIGEPLELSSPDVSPGRSLETGGNNAAPVTAPDLAEHHHERTAVLDQVPEAAQETAATPKKLGRAGYGVVVFTDDENVLESVQKAGRGRVPIYHARNIVKVVKILTEHRPGVLVTDISEDKATIQQMTAQLKEHLPELVTIAISQHRDVLDMVWLINHGQIFRFLRKPLSPGRCAISIQSALQHHRMLLKNPDLLKRHEVEEAEESDFLAGVLDKLRSVRELWAST
jgi:serine/threonine-protein kinase